MAIFGRQVSAATFTLRRGLAFGFAVLAPQPMRYRLLQPVPVSTWRTKQPTV